MILVGDCLLVMPTLEANSIDAIVSDPPYGLSFMGKDWDHGIPGEHFWAEALRVAKPGAHLVAFGGTRTYHRLACAIEDAGWDIRDQLMWVYGSGFPKSLDVAKAVDKIDRVGPMRDRAFAFTAWMRSTGVTARQINDATGTFMASHYLTDKEQPAVPTRELFELIRPLLRIPVPQFVEDLIDSRTVESENEKRRPVVGDHARTAPASEWRSRYAGGNVSAAGKITKAFTTEAQAWEGWGTALKPAWEPIILARKPLQGTVAANVLRHGTGGLNVDACRVGVTDSEREAVVGREYVSPPTHNAFGAYATDGQRKPIEYAPNGRWPANVIHDGSDEVVGMFPSEAGGSARAPSGKGPTTVSAYGKYESRSEVFHADTGSAARFFAKAEFSDEDWVCENLSIAPTADGLFNLQSEHVVSAVSRAATAALPEGMSCVASIPHFTNATPSELKLISETLITTIQNIVRECLLGLQHEKPTPSNARVSVAVVSTPTDTTTITLSHWKSDGSADPVTFNITETNEEDGDQVCGRFKYTSKASGEDRHWGTDLAGNTNGHPTVKPHELMRWLCRLVTPPGGLILDPFCGSGSTGRAALAEGFRFVGIELDPEYAAIAEARINATQPGLAL